MVLIAIGIYALILLGPMYFTMVVLNHGIKAEAKVAYHYDDEQTISRVMEHAKSWNVPLKRENITVTRGASKNMVTAHYTVHKKMIPGKWEHTFRFVLTGKKPNKGAKLYNE